MSFDRFKVPEKGPFSQYYDEFLRNASVGKRYQITLTSGDTRTGVPKAGSMAAPTFEFRDDDGERYIVPFAAVASAEILDD